MKGKTVSAFAEAELDEKVIETHTLDYIQHIPMAASSLGLRIENKIPDPEDMKRLAKDRLSVKIRVKPAP